MDMANVERNDGTLERGSGGRRKFRVRIGHNLLVVVAQDKDDALKHARRLLGEDMPRLWDVIYTLGEDDFSVEEVE
jgi:hypothetical protein